VKKRFIEWDLPLKEISEESSKEKSIRHGHPSTLHFWPARRPLSSSRTTNFAALIDLPETDEERKEITDLIKKIAPWDAIKNGNDPNILKIQKLIEKQWKDNIPRVLDPFGGGGSIPLESLRIGCETYSNDYNPMSFIIQKATIEWPQVFGFTIPHPNKKIGIDGIKENVNFIYYMVEKWSKKIQKEVKEEITELYENEMAGHIPVGYLWARTIPCQNPACNIEIPLIKQFWLFNSSDEKIAFKAFQNNNTNKIDFKIVEGDEINFNPAEGTISNGKIRCPICQQTLPSSEIRRLALQGKLDEKMLVVISYDPSKPGKVFRIANDQDISKYNNSSYKLDSLIKEWPYLDSPLPDENIRTPSGEIIKDVSGSFFVHLQPVLYGLNKFEDLFNTRQKLFLVIIEKKIKDSWIEIREECQKILHNKNVNIDDAANAVFGYLTIIFNRVLSYSSTLTVWVPHGGFAGYTFSQGMALPMKYDYLEIYPFSNSTGDWNSATSWVLRFIDINNWKIKKKPIITCQSADSLKYPDNYFDAVFTDPPYYDNVPYADLSDYFYVWSKRMLGEKYSNLFTTPLSPRNKECIQNESLIRRGKNIKRDEYKDLSIKTQEDFNILLKNSFKEMYRVLKKEGIATIVYAHKTTEGWETMLNSLQYSGFVVTASWPINTERKSRLRSISSAALASSIYMVCRKTDREKVGFYSEIQPQIKERIITKLQQFWDEGIAGGDFFISAIGPGMEIFSRYEKVEKLTGEKVSTTELLEYIRKVSTDFIVDKLLKDASSAKIDNESEFYLAYRWTYLDSTVEYDEARKLANASGINLEKLWGLGGFVKKSGSKISILGPKERGKFEPSQKMVDVMHKSVLFWEKGEREKLTQILAETGFGKDPAFKQFCQAVAESLSNGNKEKQLLEGFLIGIDAYTRGKVKAPKDQTDLKQFGGS